MWQIETGPVWCLCNSNLSSCSSYRGNDLHKAVDLVCDDFGIIGAPFSGSSAGPVSRKESAGNQFDGVKLLNDGKEDKILTALGSGCNKQNNLLENVKKTY